MQVVAAGIDGPHTGREVRCAARKKGRLTIRRATDQRRRRRRWALDIWSWRAGMGFT